MGMASNARLADSFRALLPGASHPSASPSSFQCSFAAPFSFYASNPRIPQSSLASSSHLATTPWFSHPILTETTTPHQRSFGSSIRAEKAASSTALKTPSVSAPSSKKQALIDTQPPRGTRDFPPEEMRLRTWLFNHFREVSRLFGFEEFDAPVLESEELFTRKAGEEIVGQLYNFDDKGGRRVALRPELTPSLARIILSKGKGLSLPAKWFGIGQCWRYERTTRGRRREHYQWNMDVFGVQGVEAEAELLSAIVTFFSRLGLTAKDVGFRVSSRKLLQDVLGRYSIPSESFASVCVVVDKIDKLPREEIEKELGALSVPPEAVTGILQALTLKSLSGLEDLLGADSDAVRELKQLFALADGYGIADWLQFDASVVRGLAYYTGVVFEAFDREGKLRAICGGGRYDKLLSTFGGDDTPACGFGFGDAVIVELLKERGLLPDLPHVVDDVLVTLDEECRPMLNSVAAKLRAAGRSVELVLESKKMKWVFKRVEQVGASRLIVIGSDEAAQEAVKVKDLATREETLVMIKDLV
ncbi:Histidyl-tRNA synthetase [Klebsormidium nitens]|uniref:histidine--tRNA ligase n=1 Tax=Klebsormidium nitens TaxID=105231 RepID=A0A1Y1IBJ1_KLENI|nr:Histidyl-tRNA synthetase [Klebsormidium nitens]|eukprot:GAQ86789.1 Histidyl-tRNA synthetase [Klebsormidium nitens]